MKHHTSNPTDDIQPIGVKIYIRSGVLNFSRVWCTWKDSYFEYLLNALAPLFTIKVNNTAPLISKTYILWAPSAFHKASLSAQDFNAFSTEVADLSGARFSDDKIQSFAIKLNDQFTRKNLSNLNTLHSPHREGEISNYSHIPP